MQHEFGHILQYRLVGADAYWDVIATESFASATFTSSNAHDYFWTETWANFCQEDILGKNGLVKVLVIQ